MTHYEAIYKEVQTQRMEKIIQWWNWYYYMNENHICMPLVNEWNFIGQMIWGRGFQAEGAICGNVCNCNKDNMLAKQLSDTVGCSDRPGQEDTNDTN